MSLVGIKINEFNFPVCNSFLVKIHNDQLCYQIDLNTISKKANRNKELKLGLNFLMDYNEDKLALLWGEAQLCLPYVTVA